MLSPSFSTDTNSRLFVKDLLIFVVKKGVFLFGNKFAIYNTHSLLHLIDDVNEKGSLDENSAFKFENYMQAIKKCVRTGKNPLIQVINRLEEQSSFTLSSTIKQSTNSINIKRPNNFYSINNTFCEVVELVDLDLYKVNIFNSRSLYKYINIILNRQVLDAMKLMILISIYIYC